MDIDLYQVDQAIWTLSTALRNQAITACQAEDLDAVHYLVDESRKVQNIGRTVRRRFNIND